MSESETAGASASGGNPAALSIALAGASRDKADIFLDEQTRLVRLQADDLIHEQSVRHWSLVVRHVSSVLKLILELGVGFVLLALAASISLMVWNAAHSEGLVMESFSVPPDMAAKGLSGQVIASQTIDKLTTIVATTDRSVRAAKSYSSTWGDDLKVEIPETGVSLGEAYRFLRDWLGNETHISGEIIRTANGIALTTRITGQPSVTVSGAEADLDSLLQQMAEKIFARTQPYRYGVYLRYTGRLADSIAIFSTLALSGPAEERAWGYIGWSLSILDSDGNEKALPLLQRATSLQPDNPLALGNMSTSRFQRGEFEEAYSLTKKQLDVLAGSGKALVNPKRLASYVLGMRSNQNAFLGAYREAAQQAANAIGTNLNFNVDPISNLASLQAAGHDLAAARTSIARRMENAPGLAGVNAISNLAARIMIAAEAGDWMGVVSLAKGIPPLIAKYPGLGSNYLTTLAPRIVYAQARLGGFAGAERTIAPAPATCYPCLRVRAQIAALRGQQARADFWFARAIAAAPSIPFAYSEHGEALLARGKPDDAIAKFKIANQKGPHYADALVFWGEALMAKNQSHLALAKFAQAEKYAPNWPRLHRKWGEALTYLGKKEEAEKHFAKASHV